MVPEKKGQDRIFRLHTTSHACRAGRKKTERKCKKARQFPVFLALKNLASVCADQPSSPFASTRLGPVRLAPPRGLLGYACSTDFHLE